MKTASATQQILASTLIKKDPMEMTDVERDLFAAPAQLETAEKEIERLRALVIGLAKNEYSETQKAIILL